MKANEIRLGNYLFDNTFKENVIVIETKYDNTFSVIFKEKCSHIPIDGNEVIPILLTEEWLKKFGFEKSHDRGLDLINFINKNMRLFYRDFEPIGYYYSNELKIKHVHQLQNLFFALTGEELTIGK